MFGMQFKENISRCCTPENEKWHIFIHISSYENVRFLCEENDYANMKGQN